MAKSSRSKWKKHHKRQRAQEVAATVARRVARLNGKLRLAADGGLGAVPMEDPETRFHFLNPVMDPNVPNTRKGLNNNFAELERDGAADFGRPLHLAAPRTNFHGKSDTAAPHPMTRNFDVISATAPIAGHAFTKMDLARAEAEQQQQQQQQQQFNGAEANDNAEEDDAEEFILGCNDAAGETNVDLRALRAGRAAKVPPAKDSKREPRRIRSMEEPAKVRNRVVVVAGDRKTRRLNNAPSTRLVKSGGEAARRRRSNGAES